MAEDNAFMYGLVGGLIIIAVLMLAFGAPLAEATDDTNIGTGTSRTARTIELNRQFTININGQPVSIPASEGQRIVGYLQGPEGIGTRYIDSSFYNSIGSFDLSSRFGTQTFYGDHVSNGLLFGEESMKFTVENPKNIRIFVADQNGLGDLIVMVDGKLFARSSADAGMHEYAINMFGTRNIEIRAESSEWQIWAPNIYQISRVEIDSMADVKTFEFAVDTERFVEGSVQLDLSQYYGTVEIFLNGNVIYAGPGSRTILFPLDHTNTNNQNTISIKAVDGEFSGTVSVTRVYRDSETKKTEFEFIVNKRNETLPAWLAMNIAVERPGTISIKNIHANEESLIVEEQVANGIRIIQINSDKFSEGKNTLVIEGFGNSFFTVNDLYVVA